MPSDPFPRVFGVAAVAGCMGLAAVLGSVASRHRADRECLARLDGAAHAMLVRLRLYEGFVESERAAAQSAGRWEIRAMRLAEQNAPDRLVEIASDVASSDLRSADNYRAMRQDFLGEPMKALEAARDGCWEPLRP